MLRLLERVDEPEKPEGKYNLHHVKKIIKNMRKHVSVSRASQSLDSKPFGSVAGEKEKSLQFHTSKKSELINFIFHKILLVLQKAMLSIF